MNRPELSLALLMLTLACEMALLIFMFFISRFYELKFRQATYHVAFAGSAAVFLVLMACAALGFYRYEALTLANLQALVVLSVLGLRLYRMMTGVAK
ncbi:MAG: hypothetical protein A4E28_01525 [Methanocella sp. PtaU1.Bin125]|nr:MAG: hypothetical protein A4E28_01525 [Methanocella sp. PtaU1.Bin125]